ncbi:palmitoyl-monogalactosyldiacylglycerol delta-7 desaturase, chloroplastic-like protein [Tanacetum coccineum]
MRKINTTSGGEEKLNYGKILFSDVMVTSKRNHFLGRKWRTVDIKMGVGILGIHLLALFAPFTFTWGAFWAAFWSYILCGVCGINLSYHRNLSHHSFKLPKWLEYTFAYLGVLSFQHVTYGEIKLGTLVIFPRIIALLGFGEGWHNNHHAFEYSARHGLEWWQIDICWYLIRLLEAVGLATNVKLPSEGHKHKKSFASDHNKLN